MGRASAQEGVMVGGSIGTNISTLVGVEGASFRVGYTSSMRLVIPFGQVWGTEVGIAIADQGAKFFDAEQGLQMTYTYNYINFPLVITYTPPYERWTLFGGAQMGLPVSARYDYTAPSITQAGEVVEGTGLIPMEQMHPVEFGATVGGRYMVAEHWGIEARYTYGITQTHNGISNTAFEHYYISIPDNRNSVMQFSIFVQF